MLLSASPYSSPGMPDDAPALRVSRLIQLCNSFYSELKVRVEGEIANYSVSRGKFVFFDLKDEEADSRVGCFMMLYQQNVPLEDGMRVVVEGRPGIHSKSGQFRLGVNKAEPVGQGSVKRAFDLLSAKLEKEGLFELSRKRPLPRFVSKVGIISSADAAGFGDFRKIALSRLPGVRYCFANVAVQGRDAEKEICAAFDALNGLPGLEAIVLIRGGGSMEDLHAFNSEPVARAIVRSRVPVLVGVGHERDVTIADLCADVRAATPSNAAQLLVPTKEEVQAHVTGLTQNGLRRVERSIQGAREKVLGSCQRMKERLLYRIGSAQERVSHTMKTIEAISPQQTLKRGYSITTGPSGNVIRSTADVPSGAVLSTRVSDGVITSIAA